MEIKEDLNVEVFSKGINKVVQINELIIETKNLMKPLQDRLKQLKLEKKELENEICPTMEKNDLKKAELANCTIEYKVKQAMVPMTQKSVKEKMILFFKEGPASHISFNSKKSDEKGNELFEYVYGKKNRQFIKKQELKFKT